MLIDRVKRPSSTDGPRNMHRSNRYDGIDIRILRHIRGTARLLARTHAVPGMAYEDFEQDLVFDLWLRSDAYNPSLSSHRTFADRVVAHRVATLTFPTARLTAEREAASLETWASSSGLPSDEQLSVQSADTQQELQHGLCMDVRRFVAGLSPALQRCCEILMTGNIASATAAAGLHRSSIYESFGRLRQRAVCAGLGDYVGSTPTLSPESR